jgi:hydrogenase nickel insertion protein HypA
MHEMMVAQSLFRLISAETEKQDAKPVSAKISCGVFNAVNDELLCSAFEIIAKDSPCENIKLEVEHKPVQGCCNKCKQIFELDISSLKCSKCKSEDFDLLPEVPLLLEEIEFETE